MIGITATRFTVTGRRYRGRLNLASCLPAGEPLCVAIVTLTIEVSGPALARVRSRGLIGYLSLHFDLDATNPLCYDV